ncbi:MAG: HupE/UreJ family protein [Bryobacteraceae bacterium]
MKPGRYSGCRFRALFLVIASGAAAHDIPSDVTVQAFLKPSGDRLHLLVRVPLKAMRDLDFPERERGYLDLDKLAPQLPGAAALWIANFVEIREGARRLPKAQIVATQISLESDKSFASYDRAFAHVTGPKLANNANVVWNQVELDVLFEYPIQSDASDFSVRPGLERLAARVVTVLRFVLPNGMTRAYEFSGDPGMVHLDPRWHQAAWLFVESGFFHILSGGDHLLFLLCLVIPFRRFRVLIPVVTAFTLAHSFTLIASAYNFAPGALWFPPLIETLIAISILYMALENIVGGAAAHRRWMMAFAFGLVHGFGFSFALRETLQFAGSHLLTSLLSFNAGVEAGQLAVLLLLIPLLDALFRFVVEERVGTIVLSALVAHVGWHWMIERASVLGRYRFEWPVLDAALVAGVMRWSMLILIVAGLFWAGLDSVMEALHQRRRRNAQPGEESGVHVRTSVN